MPLIHTTKGFIKACMEGKEALVRKYFAWNGIPDWAGVSDSDGNTALIAAARGGLFAVVDDLLKYGGTIDINARNTDGETALYRAVQYGHTDVIKSLLAGGADPNIPNKQGRLPIDNAANFSNGVIAKLLLDFKADPNTPNKPLMTAAAYGYAAAALALLEGGAKPDDHLDDYRTALHCAANSNKPDVMKALLDKGADINARTSLGATPLHWAVENNSVLAIEFLLARGASTTIKNSDGQTPLERALTRNFEQPIRLLEAAKKESESARPPPAVISAPVRATAPAAAAGAEGGETWVLMAADKAAHVGIYPAIDRKITEVFNFASRERLIITENLKTGAESVTPPEKFESLPEAVLRAATDALSRLAQPEAPR